MGTVPHGPEGKVSFWCCRGPAEARGRGMGKATDQSLDAAPGVWDRRPGGARTILGMLSEPQRVLSPDVRAGTLDCIPLVTDSRTWDTCPLCC